jgi:RNA-directed DNA polymerase
VRLIGQWLKAGVLEGEMLTHPEHGTPQGGVISPLLANIFLHCNCSGSQEKYRFSDC